MKIVMVIVIILLCVGAFYLLSQQNQNSPQQQQNTPAQIGQRTKTQGCQVNGALQDMGCTPGAIDAFLTKDVLCSSGFTTKSVRNVPSAEKNQVYSEYGIASHTPGQYEVDHLISLELGGSNDIANLWPEAAEPRPGFHEKDLVENYLHKQVCSGAISLSDAQQRISSNWLQIYNSVPNIRSYGYTSGSRTTNY